MRRLLDVANRWSYDDSQKKATARTACASTAAADSTSPAVVKSTRGQPDVRVVPCPRCGRKPEAQAKARPSLALQACVHGVRAEQASLRRLRKSLDSLGGKGSSPAAPNPLAKPVDLRPFLLRGRSAPANVHDAPHTSDPPQSLYSGHRCGSCTARCPGPRRPGRGAALLGIRQAGR